MFAGLGCGLGRMLALFMTQSNAEAAYAALHKRFTFYGFI